MSTCPFSPRQNPGLKLEAVNVLVNNKPEALAETATLYELLEQVNLAGKQGIAVAVNNTIIAHANWNNFTLNNNDKITVIRATQGG